MAADRAGKHEQQRAGRTPPRGTDERVVDTTVATDQEPPAGAARREPPAEPEREQAEDVPGVRKKIR